MVLSRLYLTYDNAAPLEDEIGWFDRLKERIVDVLMQPVMGVGVTLYVLALWHIERSDQRSANH